MSVYSLDQLGIDIETEIEGDMDVFFRLSKTEQETLENIKENILVEANNKYKEYDRTIDYDDMY